MLIACRTTSSHRCDAGKNRKIKERAGFHIDSKGQEPAHIFLFDEDDKYLAFDGLAAGEATLFLVFFKRETERKNNDRRERLIGEQQRHSLSCTKFPHFHAIVKDTPIRITTPWLASRVLTR